MAKTGSATQRAQLENMAVTWEQLAEARKRRLQKRGEVEEDDE